MIQTGWANAVIEAVGIALGAGYVALTYFDRYRRYKADHDALMVLTSLDAKGGLDLHVLELKKYNTVEYDSAMFRTCSGCGYGYGQDKNDPMAAKHIVNVGKVCEGKPGKCPMSKHYHPTCKECGYSFIMAPQNVKL